MKGIQLSITVAIMLFLSACSGQVNGVPEPRPAPKNAVEAGRRLIASYGCGSCHSIPGIPGADSLVAPPLDCFYERLYIAGRLSNTWDNLTKWIQHPQRIDPSTPMPDVGASKDEAYDIAAYLYNQPRWGPGNWLGRKCS